MSGDAGPVGPTDPWIMDTPTGEAQPRSYWLRSSSALDVSPRESTSDGAPGISRGPGVPTRPDQVSSAPAPLFPDSPPNASDITTDTGHSNHVPTSTPYTGLPAPYTGLQTPTSFTLFTHDDCTTSFINAIARIMLNWRFVVAAFIYFFNFKMRFNVTFIFEHFYT